MFALLLFGAGWGLSLPLAKIVVNAGYKPFGLVFWQLVIGAVTMAALRLVTNKTLRMPPRLLWFFTLIAVSGTLLPNTFSYRAAYHLPAGVMSMVLSVVPLLSFPIAMGMGIDRFNVLRLIGLCIGLSGVVILAGPQSLPNPAMILWVPVALIAPLCYATEGNIVAKWGTHGLGPGQVLYGASVIGSVLALPLAWGTGQFINPLAITWGVPEASFIALSVIHVVVYSGYVWLVNRAGSVFASQVAYCVTGFGVIWSMILLGETYSLWVWAALGLIVFGMLLVQPRDKATLAQ